MNDKSRHEPMAELKHHHPLWQTLVGAAAAAAIISGTGLAIGASGVGLPVSSAVGAPLLIDSATEPSLVAELGLGNARLLPGARDDAVANIYGDYTYPGMQRYTYTALGLSTEAGTANGYGFDVRSAYNAEAVKALAAAFGLEETPQEGSGGGWFAGSLDGSSPSFSLYLNGTLNYAYWNPAVRTSEPGLRPGDESGLAAVRGLLTKLGYDVDDFELTSDTPEGNSTTQVTASRLVDDQRTDQTLVVNVASAGIAEAYGQLAPIVELGEYPIVSERDAFERLYDSRFGGSRDGYSVPMLTGFAATEGWVSRAEPPATPTPGARIAWPVTNVNVVSSSLVLASQYQPDGTVLLLPAYEFTDSNGGTWSVIAVDESHLDFSAE